MGFRKTFVRIVIFLSCEFLATVRYPVQVGREGYICSCSIQPLCFRLQLHSSVVHLNSFVNQHITASVRSTTTAKFVSTPKLATARSLAVRERSGWRALEQHDNAGPVLLDFGRLKCSYCLKPRCGLVLFHMKTCFLRQGDNLSVLSRSCYYPGSLRSHAAGVSWSCPLKQREQEQKKIVIAEVTAHG